MKRSFALAVKAVILKEDSFLVLKRSRQEIEGSYMNQKEAWDLPGGGVRFFESSPRGLLREISEETGLTVEIIKPLSIFDAIKSRLHLTIITYLCLYRHGDVMLSQEHDAFYWMTYAEGREKNIPSWMLRDFEEAQRAQNNMP